MLLAAANRVFLWKPNNADSPTLTVTHVMFFIELLTFKSDVFILKLKF